MFTKKEIFSLLLTIFILSFAFGFDDKSETFVWGNWLGNFVVVFIMVALAFLAHQLGHKIAAKMNGFTAEYAYWGIQSLSLKPRQLLGKGKSNPFPRTITVFGKKILIESFPIGLILCFLVTLLSNGQLFFLAVGQYTLLIKKTSRFGRRFFEVTNYEEAKIALAGPLANIILMILAKLVNAYGTFDTFIFINAMLALFHMIPLSHLAGAKVYFGSRLLWVSSIVFIVALIVLVYTVSIIPLLLLSLLSMFIAGSLYYYFTYVR